MRDINEFYENEVIMNFYDFIIVCDIFVFEYG